MFRRSTIGVLVLAAACFLAPPALADPPAIVAVQQLDQNGGPSLGLDPATAYNLPAWQLLYATCSMLVNYPDEPAPLGGVITPDAAAALPTVSPDGLTYTFTVRSGTGFSPQVAGPRDLTALDFQRTFERVAELGDRSPGMIYVGDLIEGMRAYSAGTAASISGISVSGNQIAFRLVRPDSSFIAKLAAPAFCVVPSETPRAYEPPLGSNIPSSGPYYVDPASVTLNGSNLASLRLLRNPNYHGSRPATLAEFDYVIGGDLHQSVSDAIAGTVDLVPYMWGYSPSEIATLNASYGQGSAADDAGHQQIFEIPFGGTWFLHINTTRVTDVRVRQALAYAVDRGALATIFGVTADDQYLPPTMPGRGSSSFSTSPDTATAQSLMVAAGYGPSNHLALTLAVPNASRYVQAATALTAELANAYIDVTVDSSRAQGQYYSALAADGGIYDLAISGWIADWFDPSGLLEPLLGANFIGDTNFARWNDAQTEADFAYADQLTGTARGTAFGNIASRLATDAVPMVAFAHASNWSFLSSRLGCQVGTVDYGIDLGRLCLRTTLTAGQQYQSGSLSSASPVTTAVSPPGGGAVAVTAGAPALDTSGYELVGSQLAIEAPAASAGAPLSLLFNVEAGTLAAAGLTADTVSVLRNGTPIPPCSTNDGTATPDPCVSSRVADGSGNAQISVLSSHASQWTFATADAAAPSEPAASLATDAIAVGGQTTLSATAQSDAAAAELFIDADRGAGKNLPLNGGAGSFSSPSFGKTLAAGTHTIGVRVRDVARNWSSVRTLTLQVGPGPSAAPTPAAGPQAGVPATPQAGAVTVVTATATAVEATIRPSLAGSLTLPAETGSPALTWTSTTFAAPVTVHAARTAGAPLAGFALGSQAVELTFTSASGRVTSFTTPLELTWTGRAGVLPAWSSDGTVWHSIPQLAGTTLPSGQGDGYYRDASGVFHILTRHATLFGLIGKLTVHAGTKAHVGQAARSVVVFVGTDRPAAVTVILATRGHRIWKHTARVVSALRVVIPLGAHVRSGTYFVDIRAASGSITGRKTLRTTVARR